MNEHLIGLDAHQLLTVFLRREHRYIGVRGGDRAEWLAAEREIERDLRALVAGDPEAARPGVSEAAIDVPKPEVREALLAAIEDELEELDAAEVLARAAQTRTLPLVHGEPELTALRELVTVWAYALDYEDKNGRDGTVPHQARELVALHRKLRAARPDEGGDLDYAELLRERGDAETRPYGVGQTFQVGEWVDHPKFGEGVVTEAHEKVVIRFRDKARTLVHVPAGAAS